MVALLLVLVLVAFAPSIVVSFGGEGVSVVVPTVTTGEAPIMIPEAAQRFARAHATFQATGATDNDRQEFLNALDDYWREMVVSHDPHLQLIADVARTLGWLVERAHAPR